MNLQHWTNDHPVQVVMVMCGTTTKSHQFFFRKKGWHQL